MEADISERVGVPKLEDAVLPPMPPEAPQGRDMQV
jgi:hypothetical protein